MVPRRISDVRAAIAARSSTVLPVERFPQEHAVPARLLRPESRRDRLRRVAAGDHHSVSHTPLVQHSCDTSGRRSDKKPVAVMSRSRQNGASGVASRLGPVPTYVYAFDHKHRKPPMSMKDLLGGKGANLAEMTSVLGLPVPPGFTITTDACRDYMHGGWPTGLDDEIAKHVEPSSRRRWARSSATRRPAAGERAVGRQVLDARDDGHRPQPRPQRRVGRGPGQADRRRALRLRLATAASSRCTAASCSTSRARSSTRLLETAKEWDGVTDDADDAAPTRCAACPALQGRRASSTPASRSRRTRPTSSAARSRPCSARGTAPAPSPTAIRERIRHDLGTAVNVQTMVFGNRDDNSRHRRRLHPRPGHRREQAVRRLPRQRPGRGRRGRHPQHRDPRRRSSDAVPEDPQGAAGHLRPAREALPRHVRHRVHHRAGQALDAADPRRQAHRRRRAAHGRRHDQGPQGLEDQPARRRCSASPPSTSTRCCTRSSTTTDVKVHRQGPRRVAGRGGRARPTSPPTTRPTPPTAARRSSSCAARRRPRTCTA